MIAIPIPIQTPHVPDGPVFDFFFSKSTCFSSIWLRHGAIREAFGTIQAVTSCGPLRTVEQSPCKRESGSFHENRLPSFGNPGVATT